MGVITGETWLTFSQPIWLVALLASPLPLLLARRAARRRVPRAALAAQCVALALLAAALAGPRAPLAGGARLPYLLFQDASASVRGQAQGYRHNQKAAPAQVLRELHRSSSFNSLNSPHSTMKTNQQDHLLELLRCLLY